MTPSRFALVALLVLFPITSSVALADDRQEVSIDDYSVSVSIEVDRNKALEAGISLGAFFRTTIAFLEKHEQFELRDLENLVVKDNSSTRRFHELARIRVTLDRTKKKAKEKPKRRRRRMH
jgi:hypothetical protein